jgi:hypothetical protein
MSDESQMANNGPPWAKNRNGDPRQLLHEAAFLEETVRLRRGDAERMRKQAAHIDAQAALMERAAQDYRRWAKERENV